MSRKPIKGLSFPLRFGPLGHLERSSGVTKLKENMEVIALTPLHSREMHDSFGSLGIDAVLRSIDESTFSLIRDVAGTAITEHEDRVIVRDVTSEEGLEEGQVFTTISFEVRNSDEFDDLTVLLSEGT
jgi:phage baseplate assembly protein W